MYKLMPRRYQEKIAELLMFSGSKKTPQGFVNYSITFSLGIGLVIGFLALDYFFFIWPAVSLGMIVLFHGFLVLRNPRSIFASLT